MGINLSELEYKQVYERINRTLLEIPKEINTLRYLLDRANELDTEMDELNEKLDDQTSKEIFLNFADNPIVISKSLEKWIDDYIAADEDIRGISVEEFSCYLNYIRNKEDRENAIKLFKKVITGPKLEQYRNMYSLFEFLEDELQVDDEIEPELVEYKRRELLYLMREMIISIDPSEVYFLNDNRKINISEHSIYVGLRDILKEIPDESFEEIYKNILGQITNPYTKIGMGILYFAKLEEISIENPNYEPDATLVEEMLPYLALKLCIDESINTMNMCGSASEVFATFSNVCDGVEIINRYSQDFSINQQLYKFLIDWIKEKDIKINGFEFLENMAEQRKSEAINYALDNFWKEFIENERSKKFVTNVKEITDDIYIAMFLNSFRINYSNFNEKSKKIIENIEGKEFTPENLFDIGSILFFLEDATKQSPETASNLNESMKNWINIYIGEKDFESLTREISHLFQTMELAGNAEENYLDDNEIEEFIFRKSQEFYHEYVASTILASLEKRAGAKLEDYKESLTDIDARTLLDIDGIYENVDELLKILDPEKKKWLKKLLEDPEVANGIDASYSNIIPYILSMKNIEDIKRAIELLNNISTGDEKSVCRNTSIFIQFLSDELNSESDELDSKDLAVRKIILLKIMTTLPDDVLYMGENDISRFGLNNRSDIDIKEHGLYFALENLIGKVSAKQFKREYDKIFKKVTVPQIKEGLKLLYAYAMEHYMEIDGEYIPEISDVETILPTLIFQSYMVEELPILLYQHGKFSEYIRENSEAGMGTYIFANYINNYGIEKDSYNMLSNRIFSISKDLGLNNCLRRLGKLEEDGDNQTFYKEYIGRYFSDFISEERKSLYLENPEDSTAEPHDNLTKSYIAMVLNTSQYTDDEAERKLEELPKVLSKKVISSEELFDIGTAMLYLEGIYKKTDKVENCSQILSSLGENWTECYLDGGIVPTEMKANVRELLSTIGIKREERE